MLKPAHPQLSCTEKYLPAARQPILKILPPARPCFHKPKAPGHTQPATKPAQGRDQLMARWEEAGQRAAMARGQSETGHKSLRCHLPTSELQNGMFW